MDRQDITLLSLWVHLPVVTTWIGLVMFDVFVSLAPGLSTAQRGRMIAWSRPLVVIAILVILVTGIWQTMDNPFVQVNSFSTLEELRGRTFYGRALFFKHGFVLATFGLTILVRFILAPRLMAVGAAPAGGAVPASPQLERPVLWLSLLNLGACLGALIMATLMIMELH